MRHWKRVAVVCMTLLAAAVGAGAADYETPVNRSAKDVLPPALAAGPDFKVADPVVADGYMYQFTVTSTHGTFKTTGTGALRKLAHEVWAIGQLKNITGSAAFFNAFKDQAGKPLVFVKDVATKPVDTLSGIPKGVGRLFGNLYSSVSNVRSPSQDSRTKEILLIGSFKRDYATRFNIDPYSSNEVLQEELDKIGKAAAFGSWSASAATIPISGPASGVLTGTSLAKSFNTIVGTEPPPRIRIINEDKLAKMGVAPDLAKRFLDQPIYTPRQQLILVEALSHLGSATGRDAYLDIALVAANEEEANFFVNMAQILRGYHETQSPITGITMVGALTVAQTQAGSAVIPFALDYGVWTANAEKLGQNMKATYNPPGFNGKFELWVTGSLSPTAKQELQARGFTGVEQVGSRFDILD